MALQLMQQIRFGMSSFNLEYTIFLVNFKIKSYDSSFEIGTNMDVFDGRFINLLIRRLTAFTVTNFLSNAMP